MSVELPPIPPTAEARQPALDAALVAIKGSDPDFDERAFAERVKSEFVQVKQALSERNPGKVAAYLSPPLLQAWQAVADRQRDQRVIVSTTALSVTDIRLMWASHEQGGDTITVGIDGAWAVVAVGEDTGQPEFGDSQPSPLTEYWTWWRAPGVRTNTVEATHCPECGAPVDPSSDAICRFCGAALPGRLQGWVLVRADEELEWSERTL